MLALRSRTPGFVVVSPCNHKVIVLAHPPHSLCNLTLHIADDFHPLEVYSQGEAVFCKESRVRIHGLER